MRKNPPIPLNHGQNVMVKFVMGGGESRCSLSENEDWKIVESVCNNVANNFIPVFALFALFFSDLAI